MIAVAGSSLEQAISQDLEITRRVVIAADLSSGLISRLPCRQKMYQRPKQVTQRAVILAVLNSYRWLSVIEWLVQTIKVVSPSREVKQFIVEQRLTLLVCQSLSFTPQGHTLRKLDPPRPSILEVLVEHIQLVAIDR